MTEFALIKNGGPVTSVSKILPTPNDIYPLTLLIPYFLTNVLLCDIILHILFVII